MGRRSDAATLEREHAVMAMFIGCATTDQIAQKVGISQGTVNVIINRVMKRRRAERDELGDFALEQMLDQIDRLMGTHYVKGVKGDARSSEVVLKLMDRKAKLLGLDQPTQTEVRITQRSELDDAIEELLGTLGVQTPEQVQ
ncbi:hypothetical protein HH308_06215 [Gordonia sp. TBRC 11910]|uniref:HTH luxR-type domain-containing protein n=1 Tax=Gordonia asplenii TaxID=2725283 RepID=A0A848KQ48_9ACTN|nr:LuxR C-terminal-related transcriptional regulator [Gordonia asplenii]NMO00806.1 hypothetical protein [Gordonia asplenii]